MTLWFDLRYAWRLMKKSWGYSLMCASVVALSVGLAVWTNALVYSQLFKPFGLTGAESWYSIQIAPDAAARMRPSVDAYTWQEMRKSTRTVDHVGAFASRTAVLSEGEASTSLRAVLISPRILAKTAPMLGRMFAATDGAPNAEPVAILSYDTWQQYFAGDPRVIGRTARIDAAPVRIVGVLPKEFFAIDDYELWQPLHPPVLARPQDSTLTVFPLVALREGQSAESVLRELQPAVERVNREHPDLFHAARHAGLIPLHRMFTHGMAPVITMMGIMAVGILLLGCVNISMVFLARLMERSRELALRTALGAARSRLLRQCLIETALVVLLGLVAGYALATMGIEWTHGVSGFSARVLASGRSTNLPELRPVDVGYAIVFAIAVWLLSTLIPAWRITRQDAAVALAGSGKGVSVKGGNRSAGLLVGLQVVISCLVLVTCGNVVMAVQKELQKPNGLDPAGVVVSTDPTALEGRYADAQTRVRYWDELQAAIESRVAGARAAFATTPPTRPARIAMTIESRQGGDRQGALTLPLTGVSDSYFDMMGIRLRKGRLFDATDRIGTLPVVVVDENLAARYWPDGDVLGKRIRVNASGDGGWLTIVGVVSTVRGAPYRPDADLGSAYQPMRQSAPSAFHVLVRAPGSGDPRPAIRAAAYSIDRDLPLHNLQRVDEYLQALSLGYSAMTTSFIAIALITAVLAASGLFGLISRSVAQRTQEVGIRRALGATSWGATSMFLRQGVLYLVVAAFGLLAGVMIMPMMSRAIPNILERAAAVTFGVVALMALVISTASYLPTRRAVALEPGDALRYE